MEAKYETLGLLASGGMGFVELARRREGNFERLYAIKRPHPHLAKHTGFVTMFLDEARIAGLIRHPNVVSVLDVGADSQGAFLVMDYIESITAGDLLGHFRAQGQGAPLQLAARIIADAARGLHAAHQLHDPQGVQLELVHRDVSPQNILIGFDGVARMSDFGVTKALGRQAKTASGVLKGRMTYSSPEQLQYQPLDHRSDLFGLGIVLFELLSGQHLYCSKQGDPQPLRIVNEAPPDIGEFRSDLPPAIVELCFDMLAKSPTDRPNDAREVANVLDIVLAQAIVEEGSFDVVDFLESRFSETHRRRKDELVNPASAATRPASQPRRLNTRTGYGVAALLLLTIGGVAIALQSPSSTSSPTEPLSLGSRSSPAASALGKNQGEATLRNAAAMPDASEPTTEVSKASLEADEDRLTTDQAEHTAKTTDTDRALLQAAEPSSKRELKRRSPRSDRRRRQNKSGNKVKPAPTPPRHVWDWDLQK